MKIEVVVVGRDILDGKAVDEFSYWVGRELDKKDIMPTRIVAISEEDLIDEIESVLSSKRFNVLIIICEFNLFKGDKILRSIADAVGLQLSPVKGISQLERSGETVLPEHSKPIRDSKDNLLGFEIQAQQCEIYVLPKKTNELRSMLRDVIIPELEEKLNQ